MHWCPKCYVFRFEQRYRAIPLPPTFYDCPWWLIVIGDHMDWMICMVITQYGHSVSHNIHFLLSSDVLMPSIF